MKATSMRPTHPRKVKTLQQQNEKKAEEKKVTSNNISKVIKAKRPDFTELQKPLTTSLSCMSDVIEALSSGTNELRELINFECELIYECKTCRSLFRSLSNFIQHKRSHCLERTRDLKRCINGEVTDKLMHLNGNNHKGQLLATRKTLRKDIYDLLRKVGNVSEEPVPEHFFTRDLKETDAALLSFFKQQGKAESEERSATVGADGFIVGVNVTNTSTGETEERSREGNSESKQVEERINHPNHNSSKQLLNCKRLFNSQSPVKTTSSCPKLRHCYVCPLCQRYFCHIWSVHRHLNLVHKKLAEQIRKLQKKIKVKMVSVDQLKLRSTSTSLLPALKVPDKEAEETKAVSISQKSSHQRNESYPLVANGTYRRDSSNGALPNKNTILEVRAYDKRPSSVASINNLPQPRVLLTKANFSPINPMSPSKTALAESPHRVNPPKRARLEPDLSWLKKGPSVPIIQGPLTRNARALYGNSTTSLHSLEDSPRSPRNSEDLLDSMNENNASVRSRRPSDSNSDGERSSDSEDDRSQSDVEESVDSESKNADALSGNLRVEDQRNCRISEDRSSSEDNIHSLASSVDLFDSMQNKEDNSADQASSTSGVETDISPDNDHPMMSGDDSGDIERLIIEYSKPQSPASFPVHLPDETESSSAVPQEQSGFLCDESHNSMVTELNEEDEDFLIKREEELKHPSENQSRSPTAFAPVESKAPGLFKTKSRKPNGSICSEVPSVENEVAQSTEETEVLIQALDSDNSNDPPTDSPEQLASHVMEVIFGSMPSTSFSLSTNFDDNSS